MNKKLNKIAISLMICFALLFSSLIQPVFAVPSESNHWANQAIIKWKAYGLVQGRGDGSIQPDSTITRAEFAAFIDRVFKFSTSSAITFSDVPEGSWYAEPVSKLAAAGIVVGNNGKFNPNAYITRQEAAVILYRAFALKVNNPDRIKYFNDYDQITWWSTDAVSALYENGYVKGRANKMFAPAAEITRAETIVMIDNIMGDLINEPGTYSTSASKNLVINSTDVVLRSIDIPGNLYITQGVGSGQVELENVTIKGDIIILGGNKVTFKKTLLAGTLKVMNPDMNVAITITGNSGIANSELYSAATLRTDNLSGKGFDRVHITDKLSAEHKVVFEGKYPSVIVDARESVLSLNDGLIDSLELRETPDGSKIHIVDGTVNFINTQGRVATKLDNVTVTQLTIKETGENTKVELGENTIIETMLLNARSEISGVGKINKAYLNVDGATLEKVPDILLT